MLKVSNICRIEAFRCGFGIRAVVGLSFARAVIVEFRVCVVCMYTILSNLKNVEFI